MTHDRRGTLLIIDDSAELCSRVRQYFERKNLRVYSAPTGEEGLKLFSERSIDIVLLDQLLPDGEGWKLCPSLKQQNDTAKIIFITAYPSMENTLQAIRAGAYDYLSKPFELEQLELIIERVLETRHLERIAKIERYRRGKEIEATILVGRERGLNEISHLVDLAAAVESPVLITGETGTGKNMVAKAIHLQSASRKGGFVSINCAALPDHLFEGELFGYEKGAFTGATAAKQGLFETAEEGTLLLDEIGSMPAHLQSKLLTVQEEKRIRRLGDVSYRPVDVRVLAATNQEIERAVDEGRFRADLYYRLNVIRIHIPPLRDRLDDLPELCDHFLTELASGRTVSIPDDEMNRLVAYEWPGNVRELRNVIERAVLLQKDDEIRPSRYLGAPVQGSPRPQVSPPQIRDQKIPPLEEVERVYIQNALDAMQGNLARTSRALGISLSTLKRKIKRYDLKRPSSPPV
jgi:DNA-binding NtrC family response regulator